MGITVSQHSQLQFEEQPKFESIIVSASGQKQIFW